MKLILFIGSVLLLIFTLMNSVALFRMSRDGMLDVLPRTSFQLRVYCLNLSTLLLSIIGVYGSLYSHHGSLNVFAILSSLNALVILVLLSTSSMKYENDKYLEQLETYMAEYQWGLDQHHIEPNTDVEPTINWNSLQGFKCCGMRGPQDWDAYRPADINKQLYPRSCCSRRTKHQDKLKNFVSALFETDRERELCHADSIYTVGCHDKIVFVEKLLVAAACFVIVYQLLLAFLASCVGNEYEHRERQQRIQQSRLQVNLWSVDRPPIKNANTQTFAHLNNDFSYPNLQTVDQQQVFYPPPRYGSFQ